MTFIAFLILVPLLLVASGHATAGLGVAAGAAAIAVSRPPGGPTPAH